MWQFFESVNFNKDEAELDRLEPAWAKAAHAFNGGNRLGHSGMRMLSLVSVHEILEVHRRRYEDGDTLQLLIAVKACAQENVPLPTWLATAYTKKLESFLSVGGEPSLDAVFKSPILPTDTPKKAAIARQDWALGYEIRAAVWVEVKDDDSLQSLDAALDRVLRLHRFGVGKTKARQLFTMVERSQIEFLHAIGSNTQPLSKIFAKRRKESTK